MGTGMTAQLGIAEEPAWGNPTAPNRWLPLVSESLKQDIAREESDGIIAGATAQRSTQWAPGNVKVGGGLKLELYDRTTALLWKHILGANVTAGAGPYTHTATGGTLAGLGLSVQIGRPAASGVDPYHYSGCKIAGSDLSWETGKKVGWGIDLLARNEIRRRTVADGATTNGSPTVTSAALGAFTQDLVGKPISGAGIPAASYVGVVNSALSLGLSSSPLANVPVNATATAAGVTLSLGVALGAPSYTAGIGIGMVAIGARVSLAGASYPTRKGSIKIVNPFAERRFDSGDGLIDEPQLNGLRVVTGLIDSEYFSAAAYERFVNGTEAALVVSFARGAASWVGTLNVRFDGETPNVGGRDVLGSPLPFKALASSNDASQITVVTTNGDSAI